MLKTIFIREIQQNVSSLRFQISLFIVIITFAIGTVSYIISYKDNIKNFEKYEKENIKRIREDAKESASILAVNNRMFMHRPKSNGFISDCKDKYFPNQYNYSAYYVRDFQIGKGSVNPFIKDSNEINWVFIVTVILSFLSLLFSFDLISGEKETRTLALCLSNSISRGTLFFGKYLSVITVIMLETIIGVIISLIILLIFGDIQFTNIIIIDILGFLVFTLIFVACVTAFGLLTSVITKKSNISLLYSLAIWLIFIVIIPNTSIFWANKLFKIEHVEAVINKKDKEADEINRNAPEGSWSSNSGNLFHPEHELRAKNQTNLLNNEKKYMDAYNNSRLRQLESTRLFTLFSPVCLFNYITEAYLGGGYLRFKKNWNGLHVYQKQFLGFFKNFDAKDNKSPHWYNPYENYSTTRKFVDISEVPVYKEKQILFGERLQYLSNYLIIMIIYTGVIFFLGFAVFVKYDVRG
ncbi:MAG: ABC transporter permease subunit [Bacteroidetes bacterium]|nr:ABC transporter permease subunit [Bacteroidota bacterium]